MSEPIQFSLSKRWWVFLAISLVISILLFFSAGIVAGMLLRSAQFAAGVSTVALNRQKKPELAAARALTVRRGPSLSEQGPDVGPRYPQLTLQVASFEDPATAHSFGDSLQRAGFPLLPQETIQLANKTWHTVLVGPYANWDQAARVSADIQRSYNVDVYVRMH